MQEDDVDLSSFPLLRIDQINRHETKTLVESEAQLTALENEEAMESISQFVSKLLVHIRREIGNRSRRDVNISSKESGYNAEKSMPMPIPSTSSSFVSSKSKRVNKTPRRRDRIMAITSTKTTVPTTIKSNSSLLLATPPRHRKQHRNNTLPKSKSILSSKTSTSTAQQKHHQPSFFVSNNSPTNSTTKPNNNFRSRAKLATSSLKSRTNTATITQKQQEERIQRTKQALQEQSNWRTQRTKSKQNREHLLEQERLLRKQKWKERTKREHQLRSSMQEAAEVAKKQALDAGCTTVEAIVEAAAAAARIIVDDESSGLLLNGDSEDDEGSITIIVDDDCTDTECLVATELSLRCTIEDDVTVDESLQPTASALEFVTEGNPMETEPCVVERGTLLSENEDTSDTNVDAATDFTGHADNDFTERPGSVSHHETIGDSSAASINMATADDTLTHGKQSPSTDGQIDCVPDECMSETKPVEAVVEVIDEPYSVYKSTQQNEKELQLPSEVVIPHSLPCPIEESEGRTLESNEAEIEEKPSKPKPMERKFCDIFSSFSDIFAKHVNGQREKGSADVRQRELSKSMQYQVAQYARASSDFASLSQLEDEEDSSDYSCSSDTTNNAFDRELFYRINSRRPEVTSIIRKSFSHHRLSSWEELPPEVEDTCWNVQWVWGLPKASDFDNLLVFQKINRFRNTRGLTRKDLLKKNIQRFSNKKDGDYNIMPLTYALPHEYNSFVSGYQSIQKISGAANIWIIKPVGLSRGRGISVVDDIANVSYSQPIVIQRYIADPLTFQGYKWDLRMYILVTSFGPNTLEAFLYKEGLARFGSKIYSLRPELLHDNRIHLTNSSIQREFDDCIDRSYPSYLAGSNGGGNKVAFSWLWKRLKGLGMDTDKLWQRIVDVCRKALEAVGSDISHQPNCFELFGFDIMFDQSEKAWLIEANSSPQLNCDSPLDTKVKGALIRDTVALVDPPAFDRKALAEVCHRRLTHRKSSTNASSKDTLEKDLAQILKSKTPRKFGDIPRRTGNFERILPITLN